MISLMRKALQRTRLALVTIAFAAAAVGLLAGTTTGSAAYTGPFCTKVKLAALGGYCESNRVSETRRAVGKSNAGYTGIYIYATNGEELSKYCYEEGCEVGTGYLKHEDTVKGVIENVGDHEHTYEGYLYH
jgi:hypothetical protein